MQEVNLTDSLSKSYRVTGHMYCHVTKQKGILTPLPPTEQHTCAAVPKDIPR